MPRVVQTVAFFALVASVYVALAPHPSGAQRLGVLLAGSVIAAVIAYVLPWAFALHTEPVSASDERS